MIEKVDIGCRGIVDRMGDRNLQGEYVQIVTLTCDNEWRFRISKGAAENLAAEISGALGRPTAPDLAERVKVLEAENARLREALTRCLPILEQLDTLRHLDPDFPALSAAHAALATPSPAVAEVGR